MSKKILILGDDRRLKYTGEKLESSGFIPFYNYDAINNADYVLLPVPVTKDEVNISGTENIIEDFLSHLRPGMKIYGGMVPAEISEYCKNNGIVCRDYMKNEELTSKNAVLTAKGIIKEAEEAGAVICKSKCLVIGFGHCGKALAEYLKKENADVDVMVRRSIMYKSVEEEGYTPLYMFNMSDDIKLSGMNKYSYVFNTVPALVLDEKAIKTLSSNVMIFDIASKPGGTDFDYCKKHDIYTLLSLGIPGRHYPKEAGFIIADVITEDK